MGYQRIVDRLRAAGCVFAEEEADLLAAHARGPEALAAMVARRESGLPLEHVVGWAAFCGLRVAVAPGVFVPRPRSALLVDQAVALVRPGALVLDLCCGSGAVGLAVAQRVAGCRLMAVELDAAVASCARTNLDPVGAGVWTGDLFSPLPVRYRGTIEVIVVVAPYVPTPHVALLPRDARDFEPALALDGGPDGLVVLRRIMAGAPAWLAPGGHLLAEVAVAQIAPVVELARRAGLQARGVEDHGPEGSGGALVIATRDG